MSELRVTSIDVKNVLGAREIAMKPGQVTVLEGANGTGKSSVLQAVQAAIGGGNLANLAHINAEGDAEEPEVVLVVQGAGNEAYRIERTAGGVRVRQRVGDTAAFEDVPKPQSWLSSIFDGACANPVRFLTAPDKERALLLLEALPLEYTRASLFTAAGIQTHEVPVLPEGLHPLQEIALIRDAVFRQRTAVNRDQKGKAQAAEQTRRNAPAETLVDPKAALMDQTDYCTALAVQIRSLQEQAAAEEQKAVAAAAQKRDAALAVIASERDYDIARIRAEADRAVLVAKAAAEEKALEVRNDYAQGETDARRAREIQRQAILKQQEILAAAREKLSELKAQSEAAVAAKALIDQADQFDRDAQRLLEDGARLTAALDAIDAYRRGLAEKLPIPGLEIEGPEIKVDSIPFEQLNTAKRVEIAVTVATLRAKGKALPVVFVDGAEGLDDDHFSALVSELEKQGVQAFVARVAEGPLRIGGQK